MPLTPGQTLAFYQILGPLGAGGMGEVYRARDTRLEREVAIKVLPDELAGDDERLRRFDREAKTLASLNHTHIAGIFGIDQVGDTCFMAMELVTGEDLEQRLASGPLPVSEALDVCRQIAEGLEVAHEAGVVHRDLKPANVRVTPEGTVKLLDFGLAKPTRDEGSSAGGAREPSDSVLVTSEGMILGTPTYMSPEQARGRRVDRRTDIWAFGCVLYECLTGVRAFRGEAFGDLMAAILEREPDYAALPAATPPRVRRLIERCLVKDPRARLRDVGEARLELEAVLAGRDELPGAPRTAAATTQRRAPLAVGAALALGALGLAAGYLLRGSPPPPAPARQVRFTIRHPVQEHTALSNPVVAHDGSFVAYVVMDGNGQRLWVRELDAREPRLLEGTDGANAPFLTPDDRFLVYIASNRILKVSVAGGTPVQIGEIGPNPGGVFLEDGDIAFSRSWTGGLVRMPLGGGALEVLTTPDAAAGATGHWWPTPVPGTGLLLYTVFTVDGTLNRSRIECLDLARGSAHVVTEGAQGLPVAGHLLYGRAGLYELAPFDVATGRVTGPPRAVLDDVPPLYTDGSLRRFLSFSDDGTMAYVTRDNDFAAAPRRWYWMDRAGALVPLDLPPEAKGNPALSPDGRRMAIEHLVAGEHDVFVHDLEDGGETRLSREAVNLGPRWSPDGRRILFTSTRTGSYDVFEAALDGARGEALLFERPGDAVVCDLTADGATLILQVSFEETGEDLLRCDLATGALEPLVSTPADEVRARLSPDGRLLAYESDASGTNHVYVMPLDASAPAVKVSRSGGSYACWTRQGAQLAFDDGTQIQLVDVTFEAGEVRASKPAPFVEGGMAAELSQRLVSGEYAMHPDGERLVLGLLERAPRAEIEVVLDGFGALGLR